MKQAHLLLFLTFWGSTCLSAAEPVTLDSLLAEMVDRSELSRICQPPYVAKAATSYDRESKICNPADGLYVEKNGRDWGKGWFANRDFGHCIRVDTINGRSESVLLDDRGPGAIVRWWATAHNKGIIRIYLDSATEPVITGRPAELVGGDGLASYPFSFKASDDTTNPPWRGHNLYLPIPYQERCMVTWEGKPSYYQIGYRKYAPGTKVKTFTMEQLKRAQETMRQVTRRLTIGSTAVSGATTAQADVVLVPEDSTALTLSGPGAVTKFQIRLSAEDYKQALRSTVVTMTFDGQRTVWIPAGSLGGVGYSEEKNDTFYIKTDPTSGTITSYYVMPFQDTAVLTVTNYGKQDVTIERIEATVDDYQWNDRSLYFHATWFELRNISTQNRSDLNYVTIKGAGRYVGTSITIFNTCTLPNNQTWWGEGDDKVYVDGETFPSIFGTGTEDYFGYAYCRPQRFYTPFISQPRGEGNKKWGYSNNNRYHLLDDIPFNAAMQFDMEIWHPFRKNMNYAAATFFYARPGSSSNIAASIDSVRYKVALHRDDVISAEPSTASEVKGADTGSAAVDKPNVVFILADDWGIGDVKCFGGDRCRIATPHMDALAREGMMFTDAHSSSSVCTPTRYSILTGRYNWRSRLKRGVLYGFDEHLIDDKRVTVARFLKDNGYVTGCVGKWHLGLDMQTRDGERPFSRMKSIDHDKPIDPSKCNVDWKAKIKNGPVSVGFDYFYGIAASLDMPPYIWIHNDRFVGECTTVKAFHRSGPAHKDFVDYDVLPTITEKARAFITAQAKTGKPFFLYVPLNAPHTPISPSERFRGRSGLGKYADFVMETDWAVGQIVRAVDAAGLDEKTLIVVTADNGCSPAAASRAGRNRLNLTFNGPKKQPVEAERHYACGIYRGHKADIYEGGHRIPFIARWIGRVRRDSVCDAPICLVDLLATCADLIGAKRAPDGAADSVSFLPHLLGDRNAVTRDTVIHHSINGSFAIRKGRWKLMLCPGSGGWSLPKPIHATVANKMTAEEISRIQWVQLYDLSRDPSELKNVAKENPDVVAELTDLIQLQVDRGRSTEGAACTNDGVTHLYPDWIRKLQSRR